MNNELPEHVAARLRRRVPLDGHVVVGSTPVLSFGNPSKAVVATLGLNPSRLEFLDPSGRELVGSSRRFETLASLGVRSLATAPESALARVVQGCNSYFTANPYTRWFNQVEPIVKAVGASYYDGSACHLDLVQWATDPVWSKVPNRSVRDRLLAQDAEFLRQSIARSSIRLLLINGSGVIKQFEAAMGISLRPAGRAIGISARSDLASGKLAGGIDVVAWSINVQSSFGVCNALRSNLARRVAELYPHVAFA